MYLKYTTMASFYNARGCLILFIWLMLSVNVLTKDPPKICRPENEDEETEEEEPLKKPSCDEDQLMTYLAEIQAINPESIVNMATKEEVKKICVKVKGSVTEMDKYLTKCEPAHGKDLYMQLIKGVHTFHEKLCIDKQFRADFSKYEGCLSKLHEEFEECAGPADWEERDKCKLCRTYQDICSCYYIKSATLCGTKAAATFKTLVRTVFDSIIMTHCDNVKKDPVVEDSMPDEQMAGASSAASRFIPTILLASFPYILFHIVTCSELRRRLF